MANGTSGTKGGGGSSKKASPNETAPVNNLAPHGEYETKLLSQLYPHANNYAEAKEQWVKDNTEVDPSKAYDTGIAIGYFTGSYSSEIRESQKNGKNDEYGKYGELIEDYISKAPQWDNSHDLHRGMGLSADTVDGIIKGIKSGKTFDINNGGTASWSLKYAISEGFTSTANGKVPVIFRTKTMKNATSIEHMSSIHGEHEVFSSKKNNFRPIKATPKNINGHKGWLIDVEEV